MSVKPLRESPLRETSVLNPTKCPHQTNTHADTQTVDRIILPGCPRTSPSNCRRPTRRKKSPPGLARRTFKVGGSRSSEASETSAAHRLASHAGSRNRAARSAKSAASPAMPSRNDSERISSGVPATAATLASQAVASSR